MQVVEAAVPFSASRSGMIIGAGAIGMVLETEQGAINRKRLTETTLSNGNVGPQVGGSYYCQLLATQLGNSAYHGASMDRDHIAEEMERFLCAVQKENNISRSEIARHGVYFSHETSTHASPTLACAYNEIYALRKVFGSEFRNLLILNTKGFTGHAMGVSFEDVVAVEVLSSQRVPPIAQWKAHIRSQYSQPEVNAPTDVDECWWDETLGRDLHCSRGGQYPCKYALRFAAGFGSQIALALYAYPQLSAPQKAAR
jgi:3-oxoacyl-(acyl-carrier-protein) synthase